ncbi:Oar protein [Iodidimonas nitroreducens]|uniref:Oar protein n=1 Tax=Iodidimonas nitroreducens TaxID=1236968 RepID=A0A5A7NC46_9PROT|nr:TonB-dependent receptor [Iodidimonas nitroreducens]GAK32559.1 protein oar [alpha proteobacterium Q-1]GER04546.1 Oar protein [Iodidimonas nitroreducens]
MKRFRQNYLGAAKALLLLSASLPAMMVAQQVEAQQTTSGVRGVVTDPSGQPLANAAISITDSRTGRTISSETSAQGRFSATGLETGGPYTVTVESSGYRAERIEGLFLNISQMADLSISLTSGQMEEIVVTAAPIVMSQLAIGPGRSFGLETLESFPSISRDFRDIIRIDPRVSINEGNDDSISCLGGNNRFNSVTIDGVRASDGFGLNASGLPSRNNMPIPFDAVRETSVEFAPYSVEYGQFTGCNINIVTKSGTNDFHGSAFFVFNNDDLTGERIDGEQAITDPFTDKNWGAELGGPIIKDKLFFYVAYEEADDSGIQDNGPIGGGFGTEEGPTVAQVEQVQGILENQFGIETLGIARSLARDNRRILGRLDWFINDDHRVAGTYTRLRETFEQQDDFGFGNDFAFRNNFLEEGSEIETYSVRVFSQWTDKLSTEFWVSRTDNTDSQDPVGGGEAQDANPVPRIFVDTPGGTLLSGPGEFRSANALDTQINQLRLNAEYLTGAHKITAGYELDQIDVFNLFVTDATGTITFDSIEDLQAGRASSIEGNGSFTGDINDAAANFSRSIHSLYLQDEWQATDDLTFLLGLRYDFYTSSDNPRVSQQFVDRFGFANDQAFDGLDIFLPRFGITYEAPWDFYGQTTFRAGAGIFSGGDPTVWFSNAFSNFGSGIGFGSITPTSQDSPCTAADLQVIDANGNFTGTPACLAQAQIAQATGADGRVDAVDPNFKLPSVVRGSWGFTHFTDFNGAVGGLLDNWRVDFDIIHDRRRNSADFVDLTLTPVGFAPDGRLLFNAVDPLLPGCNASFLGPRIGFSGNTAQGGPCDAGGDDQDILLTNTKGKEGGTTSISLLLNNSWDYTVFNRPARFDFNFGYAFTDAKVKNPTTSSTATSNFEEIALTNINDPELASSQFANKHNITVAATFSHDFFEDLSSTLSVFFQARSGRPFSFVFDNNTPTTLFGDSDNEERNLFYVPSGPNDPRVDLSALQSAGTLDAFFNFLDETGLSKYAGQIAPRNAFRDDWTKDLDLRFQQDLPTPWRGHKFELFFDIENFLNFIDSGANVFQSFDRGDVFEGVPVLDAGLNADGSQFVFSNFNPGGSDTSAFGFNPNRNINVESTIWRLQVGIRYSF